jgi:putative peptidoglycan lipid II flippase
MNPKQQMLRSSVIVAFFNLLGGLSGILVETSIAANLGLSMRSDAFYVAYTIPYIIANLLTATSQFSLVPFFSSLETTEDEKELWRGFSYVSNILFLGLGGIALVGAAATPWIVHGIAPGFTRQQDVLATQLARWLFLIIIPAGTGEVLRSFLLSRRYFALSTASSFIRNVTSVAVILVGFRRYGPQSIFLG